MPNMPNEKIYFLLVDDLEENLLSLEALLRREGLVLLKAKSGTEALELLLKHEVALALLDVQMPGMDGFELAELMRGTERTRHIPIIFLTAGSADYQRRFRGYETGAVDFIQKPVEADILRSKSQVFFDLYYQQLLLIRQRDELRRNAEALLESDRRKDEFLATLAHELRNPLAPIRNGLQVLRMAPDSDTAEQVRTMMDRQLTHLVRLIDDLLDVARVSQGKIDLLQERISVQSVLSAAIEVSSPVIEQRKHILQTHIPEQELWIDGDSTRLAQIVGNLLNNAAKYTPEGGNITLLASVEGNEVLITVSDNGLGVDSDMLPKIFEMFTQVDNNLSRSQSGLGIGLALVKRLVEMHHGKINATSKGLGHGSSFTVRLPLAGAATSVAEISPHESTAPTVSLRVLVVDDNIPSAKTTGWMLELIGHEFTLAHDGLEALELARKSVPDVILLDIGLPGMNGYDVCKALRADPRFKDTLIIAQTGWGQERDRQLAADAGFSHHLLKPIDFEKLSEQLAQVKPLDRSAA
jgi:signal transduction histidine kinase